jgi:hypothetical protein
MRAPSAVVEFHCKLFGTRFVRNPAIAAFAAIGLAFALEKPAVAQSAFYRAAPHEIPGPAGTIIRSDPMAESPAGAKAYRVLYRSRGLRNEPIAVSGVITVPLGPPPPGGRKVWPGRIRRPASPRAAVRRCPRRFTSR